MAARSDVVDEDEERVPLIKRAPSDAAAPPSFEDARKSHNARRRLQLAGATVCLVVVGVVAGVYVEGWQFLTALYFVVQVVTTIGYGDFTPTHEVTKVLCAFYVLCALVIIAYCLNLFTESISQMESDFIRKKLRAMEAVAFNNQTRGSLTKMSAAELEKVDMQMYKKYGALNKLLAATIGAVISIIFGMVFYATYEKCSCSFGKSQVPGCSNASFSTCAATGGYVQTWGTSFYMSVITLTTVGFGDHAPKSMLGRLVGIFWMVFGVASMANWVAKLSEYFLQEHLESQERLREQVTEDSFKEMDKNNDGNVDRDEYRAYILVKHGLVTREDLDIIDKHFDMLGPGKEGKVSWDTVKQAQEATTTSQLLQKSSGAKKL